MGNKFKDMNRSLTNVKDLGTERALLYIGKKRGTLSDKEISEREQEIHAKNWLVQVDRFSAIHGMLKPLEDLEPLLFAGDKASLISYNRKMTDALERDSRAWLENIREIQTDYTERLHIAHLLKPLSEEEDPFHWQVNLNYLHLSVLSQHGLYRQQGFLNANYQVNQERVWQKTDHLAKETILRDYLDDSTYPVRLKPLPEDHRVAATVIRLYLDYLETSAMAEVYNPDYTTQPNRTFKGFHDERVRGNLNDYLQRGQQLLSGQLAHYLEDKRRESA